MKDYCKKRVLGILFALGIASLFLIKIDSSLGRWFIYTQSLTFALQKPLLGFGDGGFEAGYMYWQAKYFENNPNSTFLMLADNVHHPLSDILLLFVNYGVVSILALSCLLCAIFLYHQKHNTIQGKLGFHLMLSILLFACFSYPFYDNIFIWITLIYALSLIFFPLFYNLRKKMYINIVILLISTIAGYFYYQKKESSREWLDTVQMADYRHDKKMLELFKNLYPQLRNDYRFLYKYAYIEFEARDFDKALSLALECKNILADYDLELLLGDIYFELRKFDESLECYRLAKNMCPSRFAPLCAIYDVYKYQGKKDKCEILARRILNKPIKVKSRETMAYVNYIENELLFGGYDKKGLQ